MNPRSSARSLAALVAAAAAVTSVACSSAPPPGPGTATVALSAPTAAPPPAPPLTFDPVAAPASLTGVFRIGSPVRDLVMWRDLLPAHTPFGQLAALGPDGLADLVFGSLGAQVDLAAPLDALSLETGPEKSAGIVASVTLLDLAEAQRIAAADFELEPLDDGTYDVRPRPKAKHAGLIAKMDLACGIFPGGAPLAHHLVCAATPELLEAGGAYLSRTVTRRPAAPGMHYELPASVFQEAFAKGNPKLDDQDDSDDPGAAAGRRLGTQWGEQLAADFENGAMDLTATPSGLALGLDLNFRSLRSPFSLALVGTRAAAIPDTFWKLPADADLAVYLPGAAPAAMHNALGSMWTDFAESVSDTDIPRDTWRLATDKMSKLLLTGGPLLIAHGPAPVAKPTATPARPATPPPAGSPAAAAEAGKRFQEARKAAAGWLVLTMPEPSAAWTTGLHEITQLMVQSHKKPTSRTAPSAAPTAPTPGAPPAKKRLAKRSFDTDFELPVRASEGLPAGAIHLVHRETPNPAFVPLPKGPAALEAAYDVHIFVAGTTSNTWIAISENEALARLKLREAMTTDATGIGTRADLAPLHALPVGGIGFGSLRGIFALLGKDDTTADLLAAAATQSTLAQLPSAGAAPMFLSFSPSAPGESGATRLRIETFLSIAATIDVIQRLQ